MGKKYSHQNLNVAREQIILLHQKNLSQKEIKSKLSHLKINKMLVSRTIKRYKETGSGIPAKSKGLPRSKRTPEAIKVVRERIRRNPARSARQMARSLNMHHKTMQQIIKEDLGLHPFKKNLVAGLTDKNKAERVRKCKLMKARHGGPDIIFSDEKLFTLEIPLNKQNDRIYGARLADIPRHFRSVPRYQNASAVMVFGAISKKGKLPLKFIERGTKINKEYYKTEVLENLVLPEAKAMYGDDEFTFQQDSAPAHKAKVVQEFCRREFPDFISTQEWPASSPDLNPLDFFAWGYMLGQLRNYKITGLDHFKQVLTKIWDDMPMNMVRAACDNFFKRCKACIKVKGERFELK